MTRSGTAVPFGRIAESLGVATMYTVPFWLAAFSGIGTPMDPQYVGNMYHNELQFTHVDYIGCLMLSVLGALVYGVAFFGRGRASTTGSAARTVIALIGLALAANAIRIYFLSFLNLDWVLSRPVTSAVSGLALGVAVWVAFRYARAHMSAAVTVASKLCAALFALAALNTAVAIYKLEPQRLFAYAPAETTPVEDRNPAKTRVVWMIFDELDQRVAFEDRPESVDMPAFDAFRRDHIVANDVRAPGDWTMHSIPSLFLNTHIDSAVYNRQDDLWLRSGDAAPFSWREARGIFQNVRASGWNAALLAQGGHPYCRLFSAVLAQCAENNAAWTADPANVLTGAVSALRSIFFHIPLTYRFFGAADTPLHWEPAVSTLLAFEQLTHQALRAPDLDLILVHWNVPHWPFVYDHVADTYIDGNLHAFESGIGYLGNLELADRLFADARKVLMDANLWDGSAVIVSADHRWRNAENLDGIKSDGVPFMLKLPGRTTPVRVDGPVDAIGTAPLIMGLLGGDIATPDDAIRIMRPSPDQLSRYRYHAPLSMPGRYCTNPLPSGA
jgi:hypothetical protein